MIVGRTLADVRAWRASPAGSSKLAFVPTMGALHEGHTSLVRLGLNSADLAAASIFVNPTQFAAHEDLSSYPRNEARDLDMLREAGCAFVYCPRPEEIYPPGDCTRVVVKELSHILEGVPRPHFFEGVATVVSRLFLHVAPDVAVFGEKDFQQLQVIRRMTRDLGFPVEIVGGPTIREPDGLAMSSRNAYLTADQRKPAAAIFAAMSVVRNRVEAGGRISEATAEGSSMILSAGFDTLDYVEVREAASLGEFPEGILPTGADGRILVAARIGRTRLIDNIACRRPD